MQRLEVKKQHPIFNGKYNITEQIGQGNTSKVYLGLAVDPAIKPAKVAIKILKQDFIQRSEDNLESFRNEIQILRRLSHENVVRLVDFGDQGLIIKPSGRRLENLIFLVMEFVEGRLLFDVCKSNGAMGEDVGRLFAHQMLDSMEYML
jgi:serine/threonine-protein kinase